MTPFPPELIRSAVFILRNKHHYTESTLEAAKAIVGGCATLTQVLIIRDMQAVDSMCEFFGWTRM